MKPTLRKLDYVKTQIINLTNSISNSKQVKAIKKYLGIAAKKADQHKPCLDKKIDPLMIQGAGLCGYFSAVHEIVQSINVNSGLQSAMLMVGGLGLIPWNKNFLKNIREMFDAYNIHRVEQKSSGGFGWCKSALLVGTTCLAFSIGANYILPEDQEKIRFQNSFSAGMIQPVGAIENKLQSKIILDNELELKSQIDFVNLKNYSVELFNSLTAEPIFEPEIEFDLSKYDEPSDLELILNDSSEDLDFSFDLEQDFKFINDLKVDLTDIDLKRLSNNLQEELYKQEILDKKMHSRTNTYYVEYVKSGAIKEWINRTRQYEPLLRKAALKYNIPYTLLYSTVVIESKGKKNERSYAGALGLMQIMPGTADYIGSECRRGRRNPEINIECGSRYLRQIKNRIDKRYANLNEDEKWNITLACYNRGPSGFINDLKRNYAKDYWGVRKSRTSGEAFRYVPRIRCVERIVVERLKLEKKDLATIFGRNSYNL
ncbi:transglycosylase SLT domain-containing protein [Candidatus Woesearchaeota archaeon]|jgi:hypothetical protein|nr:transglycosylase SLT domain-containing protein [Candidatus Woesearchaeota archaeon]MBT7368939.1 transglycosylase SLT domain-containing protein [Candidatus Woesearchaeota archaeon]